MRLMGCERQEGREGRGIGRGQRLNDFDNVCLEPDGLITHAAWAAAAYLKL